MTTPQTIAVLTGDLINSTALGPEGIDRAMDALRDAAQTVEGWGICGPLHFTRHRGDGWQIVVDDPRYALRVAVMLRATLRAMGADSYIGIAEGSTTGPVGPNLNAENHHVFSESGHALDVIKDGELRTGHMIYVKNGAYMAAAVLLDRICTEWTPTQAEVIVELVRFSPKKKSLTDIAATLGKSRQTVTKSLVAAWGWEIDVALGFFESSFDD